MIFLGQEPTSEEKTLTPQEQGMAQEDGDTKGQTTPQNDNNAEEDFLQSTPQHVGPTQRRKLTKQASKQYNTKTLLICYEFQGCQNQMQPDATFHGDGFGGSFHTGSPQTTIF